MRLPTIVVRSDVLSSWLTISSHNKSQLATELGVSKGRVSQLLTSLEEPSAHLIAKLMALTLLPFERLFKVVYESPSPSNSGARANHAKKRSPAVLHSSGNHR